MKRLVKVMAAVSGSVALTLLSGPVLAAPPPAYADPQVAWTGANIIVSPHGSAYLQGKYKCYGGEEGTHLWVSVKQGPRLSEPDQTGSSYADAWYDTNWNFENSEAGLTVDCDGHWHVTRYELKQVFGELHDGPAFVQFCLFDSTSSENSEEGFIFDYSWKPVKVSR